MIKYIVRDNVYDESFFDSLKVIMSNYWGSAVDTNINGIILYDDKIEVALVKSRGEGSEWFHSIKSKSDLLSEPNSYYSDVYSHIMSQIRNGKLKEIGI